MTAIISPTEPNQIQSLGTVDWLAEDYGADMLIPSSAGYFIGVQRKVFPADFISSLHDGRLSTSLVKLLKCEVRVLLLEGKPSWTTTGFLVSPSMAGLNYDFSRSQLRNLLMSAHFELGIHSVWTDNITDTMDLVRDLIRWGEKPRHDSLFTRPGPDKQPNGQIRRRFTPRDRAVFVLQGFDGIGPELAGRIYDYFGRIPLKWDDEGELANVDGIGPGRISKLKELFR